MANVNGVVVLHTRLTPAALRGLAEEFVTRDGTDYGHVAKTLDQKVAALMCQLERGEAAIVYDSESQTTSIVPKHSLPLTASESAPRRPDHRRGDGSGSDRDSWLTITRGTRVRRRRATGKEEP